MNYIKMYQKMLLIRQFEEKAHELYRDGHIAGFCHLYIGQEAIVVGVKAMLADTDFMITGYRDHGHMLACDMDPKGVMAELTGRIGGFSKGKGGSMHMFSKEKRFMGGHGIVGTTASLGSGMAFAQKYQKTGGITCAFMGDGAMNQGQVFESFNLAVLWNLPVLFIIEDNGYAIGTSKPRSCAGGELYKRGEPFGIPGKLADGMDIDEVIKAAKWGIEYVRTNSAPAILQFDTYRFKGHSVSDSTRIYRSREEEMNVMANRDCLQILAERIKISVDDKNNIENVVGVIVQESADFAMQSPEPPEEELWTDIYLD